MTSKSVTSDSGIDYRAKLYFKTSNSRCKGVPSINNMTVIPLRGQCHQDHVLTIRPALTNPSTIEKLNSYMNSKTKIFSINDVGMILKNEMD